MMRIIAIFLCTTIFISTFSQLPEEYMQALIALETNNPGDAIVQFSNCIKSGTEPEKSYYYQGKAYLILKDYQLAELDFLKALELNVDESALELSKLYAKLGNNKKSIDYLNKYIELNPDQNPNNIFKDPDLKILHNTDEWFAFMAEFTPSEKWEWISETDYLLSKKQFREAHNKIDEALAHFQNDASLHTLKSKIYIAEENYTLANYEMSLAFNTGPENINVLIEAVDLAKQSKQYNKAYKYLEKVKELEPERFKTSLELVEVYLLAGQNHVAQDEIEYFINIFPNNKQAIFYQAEVYYANGKFTSSLKAINKLFSEDIIKSEWYLLRGKTYYETNVIKYASEDLSMCLDLTPNSSDANYYMGLTQKKLNKNDLACYYLNRAYKLGDERSLKFIQANCIE